MKPSRRQLIGASAVSLAALAGCVRIDQVDNQADEVSVETGDFDVNARGSGEDGSTEDDAAEDDEEEEADSGNEESAGDDAGNDTSGPALSIIDTEVNEFGFTTVFDGEAQNTSDETLSNIELFLTMYGEDGEELDSNPSDTTDQLGPGEIWDFSITAVGVSADEVADYDFTFSSE